MNRKGLLPLLLLLSLSSLSARELQLSTAFSYNPSLLSSWGYGASITGLYADDNFNTSAGLRYQKNILNLAYQFTYDITGGKRIKYLTGSNIVVRSANPFFLTLKGEFELFAGNGWENIIGFQAGKILGSTAGKYRAGISLALGAYIHMSKAEGFRNVMVSFAPDATLSLFFTLFDKLYTDLSFITAVPYYFPKQVSYGWSFALFYDLSTYFILGLEGYLFFTDLIGETEVYGRRELSLSATVRLPS